jgi:hypothetical protein
MRLTSTGLGIGTSSPGAKLDVQGGQGGISNPANGTVNVVDTTTAAQGVGGQLVFKGQYQSGAYTQFAAITSYKESATVDGSQYGAALLFNTRTQGGNNTEKMRIDSSGNLGLGVTPSAWVSTAKALQVKTYSTVFESAAGRTSIAFNAYESATNNYKYVQTEAASAYQQVSGGHYWFTAPSGTAGSAITFTQAMTLDASGNLGVGTTSPGAKLQVGDAGSTAPVKILIRSASADTYLQSTSSGSVVGTPNGVPLIFNTNDAERARFDSSGNLLIGTTTVGVGNTQGMGVGINSGASYASIGHVSGTASGSVYVSFGYNGGAIGNITQNGTAAVAYNTSSDYRLKQDIQPMTGALAKVAALKPVTYKWKADGSDGEGFIAHELAEVCPHAVTGEKDAVDDEGNPKYQGIDTGFLVATLAAAIQELKTEFDAYKATHP